MSLSLKDFNRALFSHEVTKPYTHGAREDALRDELDRAERNYNRVLSEEAIALALAERQAVIELANGLPGVIMMYRRGFLEMLDTVGVVGVPALEGAVYSAPLSGKYRHTFFEVKRELHTVNYTTLLAGDDAKKEAIVFVDVYRTVEGTQPHVVQSASNVKLDGAYVVVEPAPTGAVFIMTIGRSPDTGKHVIAHQAIAVTESVEAISVRENCKYTVR